MIRMRIGTNTSSLTQPRLGFLDKQCLDEDVHFRMLRIGYVMMMSS